MAFTMSNDGDNQMLLIALNKAAVENMILHLYSNSVTASKANTAASFTECSGSGYAAITLSPASWTVTEGTGNGSTPTSATYPQQTFTLTGALTAYGYYLTGATSGKLYWSEVIAGGPDVTPSGGGTISVTLNLSSFS